MTSRIISGNRIAEDVLREYLAKPSADSNPENPNEDDKKETKKRKSKPKTQPIQNSVPPATAPSSQSPFYSIDKSRLVAFTTNKYRKFLRDAGYADINACSRLEVAKGMLTIDQNVQNAAANARIDLSGRGGDYVVNINHPNARKLVNSLGYQVLPVGLMYKVFIPYIKELVQQGNSEAETTLKEMTDTKAEWLEDIVADRTIRGKKLKIGTKEVNLSLLREQGYFEISELNDYGYPTKKKDSGTHYYWPPSASENAAFRSRSAGLYLVLDGEPSLAVDWLGVRLAKFFK